MTDEVRDGGMNLLGKVDAWDNLIRIKSESVAQELMGMILKEFCDNDLTSSIVAQLSRQKSKIFIMN